MKSEAIYVASQAWVQGTWAKDVLLTVAPNGTWKSVQPQATPAQQVGATHLAGPVLPGLVNAHSHAFQRAIVGLTERRSLGARGLGARRVADRGPQRHLAQRSTQRYASPAG